MNEWNKLKDKLPEVGEKIIFMSEDGQIRIATLHYTWSIHEEGRFSCGASREDLAKNGGYWMNLPELPKNE